MERYTFIYSNKSHKSIANFLNRALLSLGWEVNRQKWDTKTNIFIRPRNLIEYYNCPTRKKNIKHIVYMKVIQSFLRSKNILPEVDLNWLPFNGRAPYLLPQSVSYYTSIFYKAVNLNDRILFFRQPRCSIILFFTLL